MAVADDALHIRVTITHNCSGSEYPIMTMTQLTEHLHIYRGGVNFALIEAPGDRLILIDSGLDSGNARKALRPFFDRKMTLAAIINTHSHADHIGGNADLVKRTGCEVLAPAKERPFILWPQLEPMGLYGAWPLPGLQVKLLQAQPTPAVTELPAAPCQITVAGVELELIPVPGHAFDQVAIAFEGVLLVADGLFSPAIIAKHPVIFLGNVAEYLMSLERIAERAERYILPGHGDLIDRQGGEGDPLPGVLADNRLAIERLQAAVLEALNQPTDLATIQAKVGALLGKTYEGEPQYFLDRATIAAHVSHLVATGQIRSQIVSDRWQLMR